MNSKIELLDDYISKCTNCKERDEALKLEEKIISAFGEEIKDVFSELDYFYMNSKSADYLRDIALLKAKLENYKASIECEMEKHKK